jgi:hypothetical protein
MPWPVRLWRGALLLGLLLLQGDVAACGSPHGPSCLRNGALCSTGSDCCSGSCACVDLSEACQKCVAR